MARPCGELCVEQRGAPTRWLPTSRAKGGKAIAVHGDFSRKEDIGKVFGEVKKTFDGWIRW